MHNCLGAYFGLISYEQAWDLQRRIHRDVANANRPDTLVLLEHPHVYTLGRRGKDSDILIDETLLANLGAKVHHIDRGGEVTYHGPGQLVGYPIINLRRLEIGPMKYVRGLETMLETTISEFGINSMSEAKPTGVWVKNAKIASIGIKISHGVTTHGFAINVNTDLAYFNHIIACGLPGSSTTSINKELGHHVLMDDVVSKITPNFGDVFGFDVSFMEPTSLLSNYIDTTKHE